MNSLAEVGIKLRLRPIERAAFTKEYGEKKYRNIIQGGSGAFGNAATRMETFVVKGGAYVYGSYPDIDELFAGQVAETDPAKRTKVLHRMQQLVHERTVYAPLWQLAFLNGQGPRVDELALGLIAGHPYSAPYEDVRMKTGSIGVRRSPTLHEARPRELPIVLTCKLPWLGMTGVHPTQPFVAAPTNDRCGETVSHVRTAAMGAELPVSQLATTVFKLMLEPNGRR